MAYSSDKINFQQLFLKKKISGKEFNVGYPSRLWMKSATSFLIPGIPRESLYAPDGQMKSLVRVLIISYDYEPTTTHTTDKSYFFFRLFRLQKVHFVLVMNLAGRQH